jgi:hypothetical protein
MAMNIKKVWLTVGLLFLIPVLPMIFTAFFNTAYLGSSDVWVYTYSMVRVGDILVAVKAPNYINFYEISSWSWRTVFPWGQAYLAVVIVILGTYIFFPIYKLIQSLTINKKLNQKTDKLERQHIPEWKSHNLAVGTPSVFIVAVLYMMWVVYAYQFHISIATFFENNTYYLNVLLTTVQNIIVVVFLLLVARLTIVGSSQCRDDNNILKLKEMGLSKILFSLYYIFFIVLMIISSIFFHTFNTPTSPNQDPNYMPGGSYPDYPWQ